MKKILALIMALVACFCMLFTACAPDNNDPSGGGQGGQEEVLPGEGTGNGDSQQPEQGSGEGDGQQPGQGTGDDDGGTVIPPITDGGAYNPDGNY